MRQALLRGLAAMCLLVSAAPAAAERNWEFSIGGYGGWAFHGDTTLQFNQGTNLSTLQVEPVDAKATNVRFEDNTTFGAKLTAWHLPRKYSWQPQIGLEIDWTRFTADVPSGQVVPGFGTFLSTGTPIGFVLLGVTPEFAVDTMAVNLLFRYPIWATEDMPQGRWYPYVGIGGGAQRARLSRQGYEETSYSPSVQALTGLKFFVIKYLAVFAEAKWTQGWHTFKYETDSYWERYSISTIHLVGGVAVHF
ncbi:MAG: hypothetical protein MRJ66_15595 [Nitrospira sp.]|nr:hypothetical protein [Nitrospira sp.]MDR4466730.1 hypothetical protein [Nitrospira sp.]